MTVKKAVDLVCPLHQITQDFRQIDCSIFKSLWHFWYLRCHFLVIPFGLYVTRLALAGVLRPFGVHLVTFTLPGVSVHYLGSAEFPVKICDDTHKTYLIYPMIVISENTWSFDSFWHCQLVGLWKRRIIEPSLTAFIGFPFALVFHVCSWNALHNVTKNFGRLGIFLCSRVSHLNFLLCLNTQKLLQSSHKHLRRLRFSLA